MRAANAAYAPAVPSVAPFLTHRAPAVRAAAVLSLRLVPGPAAEGLLATRLAEDDDVQVRLGAVDAAQSHPSPTPTLLQAVQQTAAHDAEPRVRLAGLRALGKWLPTHPALRPTLQSLTTDPNPNLRLAAQALLAVPAAR